MGWNGGSRFCDNPNLVFGLSQSRLQEVKQIFRIQLKISGGNSVNMQIWSSRFQHLILRTSWYTPINALLKIGSWSEETIGGRPGIVWLGSIPYLSFNGRQVIPSTSPGVQTWRCAWSLRAPGFEWFRVTNQLDQRGNCWATCCCRNGKIGRCFRDILWDIWWYM